MGIQDLKDKYVDLPPKPEFDNELKVIYFCQEFYALLNFVSTLIAQDKLKGDMSKDVSEKINNIFREYHEWE